MRSIAFTLLLLVSPLSMADERLEVVLTDHLKVSGAVEKALPILWQRLLPIAANGTMEPVADAQRLMRRIVPGHESILVGFDRDAVFHYLRQHDIPYLVVQPAFHLTLEMLNSLGDSMPQSQALISEHAKSLAMQWGITLDERAPRLSLTWQWLANHEIELRVLTTGKMVEFSEMRPANAEDPLTQLNQWLEEVLLKARDAYAYQPSEQADLMGTFPGIQLLTIERVLSLSAQVEIEHALQADPRITIMLPYQYAHQHQRYQLQLNGDDHWLADWFAQRHYHLAKVDHGWVAK
ncbi:MAG: hypothetical protein R8M38_03965 [Mariprofundaceae bacterium]